MALRVGGQVILHGLSARADLNGASGVLRKYDEEKCRWTVAVDGQAKKLALKAENLRAVSHTAEALPAAPEEVVPTEFLYCRVQARGDGAKKHAEADVVDSLVAGMNHSSFFGGGAFCSHAGAGTPTYKAPLTVTRTTVRDCGAGALIIFGLGPVAIKDSHFLRCSGH